MSIIPVKEDRFLGYEAEAGPERMKVDHLDPPVVHQESSVLQVIKPLKIEVVFHFVQCSFNHICEII